MGAEIHELTAAYALDALDEIEERQYEDHLRGCDRCRADLAAFTEVAGALAYAVEAPPPPAALRSRILEQARGERANVVPLRARRVAMAAGVVAAVAATVALVLGLWANSLSNSLDAERAVTAVLQDPTARSTPLTGARGNLVRTASGDAVLVVSALRPPPEGKTYEVWVARDGSVVPAGLFEAEDGHDLVRLTERVPARARVMVTLERDGGVDAPTGAPLVTARA